MGKIREIIVTLTVFATLCLVIGLKPNKSITKKIDLATSVKNKEKNIGKKKKTIILNNKNRNKLKGWSKKEKQKLNKKKKSRKIKFLQKEDSCTISFTCIDKAVRYMKQLKDKIPNFDKQRSRIIVQNRTRLRKKEKNDIFGYTVTKLSELGGGNISDLTCNGKRNSGSKQLENLTTSLALCSDQITHTCDQSSFPLLNMTEISICINACKTFKVKTASCLKKSGTEACSCWNDNDLEEASEIIAKCDRKLIFFYFS